MHSRSCPTDRGHSGRWTVAFLATLAVACLAATPWALADPQDKKPGKRRIVRKKQTFPEPKPDLTVPIGTPSPAFVGEAPASAMKLERTGTYGGTLVYAEQGEVDTFNPVEPKGATSQELRRLMFSSLVGYSNASWKWEPQLAESWSVSDDKKTWRFKIRQGVRWNDGQPLTIADVEFSFKTCFDDRYKSSIQDGFRDEKGRLPMVAVEGDDTLVLTTHDIDSQLLTHAGQVMIIPKHKWAEQSADGTILQEMTNACDPGDLVGTGPFIFQEYIPAQKAVFTRNPYYWKIDARGQRLPYLDRVVIVLVKDQNLRWQKFEAGEHHVVMDIPGDHYREAQALEKNNRDKYQLHRLGVNLNTYWICWNLHPGSNKDSGKPYVDPKKRYWFNNKKFRHAINHAIDRQGLVKSAMQGRGKAIWGAYNVGNKLWHSKTTKKYPYDLAKANAILDELGWRKNPDDDYRTDDQGNMIEFSLNTNVDNPIRQQMGGLIKEDLRKIGVKVNFQPENFNLLVDKLQDSHEWDVILLGWGAGVPPDPANAKNIVLSRGRLHAWHPQQVTPATEWEAEVDSLVAKMDRELEYKKRKEHQDRIAELMTEECPIMYLCSPNAYSMAKKSVGNVWPSVLRPQVTWNIDQLYLIDGGR
ncbi:MAG: ABC transporter substrate-binding protein [Planctomycetota bacterium]